MPLKKSAKIVIEAFSDGTESMEHPATDFEIVKGTLRAGTTLLARWNDKEHVIDWIGTGGAAYQAQAYRYLKKITPKNKFRG